jgi:hypothetical protein
VAEGHPCKELPHLQQRLINKQLSHFLRQVREILQERLQVDYDQTQAVAEEDLRKELAHLQQQLISRRLSLFLTQDKEMLQVMKTKALYLNKL